MLENKFQRELKKKIENLLPGSIILKNDANLIQGIPDLLILYKDRWAALECKCSTRASRRPNQDYWVSTLYAMSYAAFIYPENEEEILNELQHALTSRRPTRISRSK